MALDMDMVRTLLGLPQDSKDEEVVNKILELRMKVAPANPLIPQAPVRNPHLSPWWVHDPGPTSNPSGKKSSTPYWLRILY